MTASHAPLAVLLSLFLVGCSDRESGWTGTMYDSAGVTMVSNTEVGVWSPGEEWTLEEDLRIGAVEGAVDYQFGQVGSITLDSKGRIHVLDEQAQHIQVYSAEGIYEQTIGRPGGGPGELAGAYDVLMGSGDTLLMPDWGSLRFSRYAPDGSSAGSIPMPPPESGWPLAFKAAAGAIVEQVRPLALPGQPAIESLTDALVLLASDGSITDTLMTFPSGKGISWDGKWRFFEFEPLWDLTDHSEIVLCVNDEYRLGIYSNGHVKRIITKTFERKPVSEGDKAALVAELERRWDAAGESMASRQIGRNRINFAEFLPAITRLAAGPMGTIWVQPRRLPSELSEDEWASIPIPFENSLFGVVEWDVFDAEGRFLGPVTMPDRFTPSLFRDEMIYGIWSDELDVEYVVRLRIVGDLSPGAP